MLVVVLVQCAVMWPTVPQRLEPVIPVTIERPRGAASDLVFLGPF